MPYNDPTQNPLLAQFLHPYKPPTNPLLDAANSARQPSLPPLTQQEQDSLLATIGSGALHGLGYVGGSLSKAFGGRAIRGILKGRTDELASIIPFSDALGITDPGREVRGSDLLGGDENTSLFSPQGVGGFALDVALDPATWVGAPIIKALGKGASLAGSAAMKAPLGIGSHVVTPTIEKAAPLYHGAASLLYKPFMGQTEPVLQNVAKNVVSANVPKAEQAALAQLTPIQRAIQDLAGYTGGEVTPAMRQKVSQLNNELAQVVEGSLIGPQRPGIQPIADAYTQLMQGQRIALENAGFDTAKWGGGIPLETRQAAEAALGNQTVLDRHIAAQFGPAERPFVTRQATEGRVYLGAGGRRLSPQEMPGRLEFFKEPVPVAQAQLNALSMDKTLAQTGSLHARDVIAADMLGVDATANTEWRNLVQAKATGQQLTPGELIRLDHLNATMSQAEQIAHWHSTLDHDTLAKIGGFFANDTMADLKTYILQNANRLLKADGVHQGIAKLAQPAASLGAEGVQISKVLEDAGLGTSAGRMNAWQALQNEGKLSKTGTINDLASMAIPRDKVDMITKFLTAGTSPAGMNPILSVFDSFTNLGKAFVTQLWPANHARNQWTAVFKNWLFGASDPTAELGMGYVKPWLDAKNWYEGSHISGIERMPRYAKLGLSPEQAMTTFQNEMSEWGLAGKTKVPSQEFIGSQGNKLAPREMEMLGAPLGHVDPIRTLKEAASFPTAESRIPWNIGGVGENAADLFSPVKAGRELGTGLDVINKASVYLAKSMQGMTPEAAFEAAIGAHYDFGNLTNFERDVVRRAMPFYNWMRQNIPAMFGELLKNPGGKLGMSIRAATELEGRDSGFTPDYLGAGIRAKVGQPVEGKQTFLSSLGLPFEDVAQLTSASGALGSLNPLIKGPLELATNRQFYTGRDLTGSAPHTGTGSTAADELLSMTPATRFMSTARQAMDPRLSWPEFAFNLLSGGRVSNVDVEAARRNAIRQFAEQQLQQLPVTHQFKTTYVKRDDLPSLSPTDLALYRMLQQVQK
jgi:hypothetical protein